MSGDNKCASCGQFSGRGHKCPTPVAPATIEHARPEYVVPVQSGPDVTDRVARAQHAIQKPEDTTPSLFEQEFPAPPGYTVGFEMIEEGDPDDPRFPDLLAICAAHDISDGVGQCNFSVNHARKRVTFAGDMWVDPDHRRKGLATAMVNAMEQAYPGYEIDPNGFTEDGLAFWQSR